MGESRGIANFILNQPHEVNYRKMKIQILKIYIYLKIWHSKWAKKKRREKQIVFGVFQ